MHGVCDAVDYHEYVFELKNSLEKKGKSSPTRIGQIKVVSVNKRHLVWFNKSKNISSNNKTHSKESKKENGSSHIHFNLLLIQ